MQTLNNRYLEFPALDVTRSVPRKAGKPALWLWNSELASSIGLVDVTHTPDSTALAGMFAGNELINGSEPLALAYAGHQFGHWVAQLGDGRAHILGDVQASDGLRYDIQLKGSGRTRYSRGGDGLCALGPALREYLMSEALHALGVPTARSLSVVLTGDPVFREGVEEGAVVSRVAAHHLRIGSLQYYFARSDVDGLKACLQIALPALLHGAPSTAKAETDEFIDLFDTRGWDALDDKAWDKAAWLFTALLSERMIAMVVHWLRIGFIHGVMNTDNMSLLGITIDYGPCAMMNHYDPDRVFSSIDTRGRYRFAHQPHVAIWNFGRMLESLTPLFLTNDSLEQRLHHSVANMQTAMDERYYTMMAEKLGVCAERVGNSSESSLIERRRIVDDLLVQMKNQHLDYTNTFRLLTEALADREDKHVQRLLKTTVSPEWLQRWREYLGLHEITEQRAIRVMQRVNPSRIPRNHLVESALAMSIQEQSPTPAIDFLNAVRAPYAPRDIAEMIDNCPTQQQDWGYRTFCGT